MFRHPVTLCLLLVCSLVVAAPLVAQDAMVVRASDHEVVVQIPGMDQVHVHRNLVYGSDAAGDLLLDLYYPPQLQGRTPLPVVLLGNGAGDEPSRRWKDTAAFESWARLLAASGMAAVTHDARGQETPEQLHQLIHYLQSNAGQLLLDGDRMALWSASSHAEALMPSLGGEIGRHLSAAVFLYGAAEGAELPTGLPMLVVKGDRDDRERLDRISAVFNRASSQGADVTWLIQPDGGHGFDLLDDSENSRIVVMDTVGFLGQRLSVPPAGQPQGVPALAAATDAFDNARWAEAVEHYQRHLATSPDDGMSQFRMGYASILTGQYDNAIGAFERCRELQTAVPPATYNLACCYALKEDREQSLSWLAKAVEAGFTDFELARTDPDLLFIRDDPRFELILEGGPYAPPPPPPPPPAERELGFNDHFSRAQSAFQQGDWERAARSYGRALEIQPDHGAANFNLGYASIQLGDHARATRAFEKAVAANFQPSTSTYNLACCYALRGKKEVALEHLAQSVQLGFTNFALARTDPDLDNIREDARFEPILSGQPYVPVLTPAAPARNPADLLREATAAFQAQDWNTAVESYRAYLEQNPDDGGSQFRLGFSLLAVGEVDASIPRFHRSAELGFAVPVSYYNLACGYARKGEREAAFQWLARAVDQGFDQLDFARQDPDLAPLREDGDRFERTLLGETAAATEGEAQSSAQGQLERANELFGEGRWADAAHAYQVYLATKPDDGLAHFRHGYASIRNGSYETATAAYHRAVELGFRVPASSYNLACCYALRGHRKTALDWLEKAADAGFNDLELLESDPDLDSLREEVRFTKIHKALKKGAYAQPAPAAPQAPAGVEVATVKDAGDAKKRARQFDFWVGHWDVFNPQGRKVGTNRIERVENGAALMEHWTSASGNTGTSINLYNPNTGKWQQTWVDDQGGVLELVGGLNAEGAMVLSQEKGARIDRITWTPVDGGRVRQHWQVSQDGGRSWTTAFDGTYVPRRED